MDIETINTYPSVVIPIAMIIIYIYWYVIRYLSIDVYRYKIAMARDGDKNKYCIVKLQLLWGSTTDEDRIVENDKYAWYKTNLARVVSIYDINDSTITYESCFEPSFYTSITHVNRIIEDNSALHKSGIYFKTELAARSYAHLTHMFSDSEECVKGDVLYFDVSSGKRFSLMNYDENNNTRYIELYTDNRVDITYNYVTLKYTKYDKQGVLYTGKVDVVEGETKPIGKWKMWLKHLRKNGGYYEFVGADHPNISIDVILYP